MLSICFISSENGLPQLQNLLAFLLSARHWPRKRSRYLSRTGKDEGRVMVLIGSRAPLSWPFPIKGKGGQVRCSHMSPFSSSVGERKLMNHFVVKTAFLR